MNDKRLSNCMLYPAGLYGAKTAMFTYTKTIPAWFYTPSMNHGKRSVKVSCGKPPALVRREVIGDGGMQELPAREILLR